MGRRPKRTEPAPTEPARSFVGTDAKRVPTKFTASCWGRRKRLPLVIQHF